MTAPAPVLAATAAASSSPVAASSSSAAAPSPPIKLHNQINYVPIPRSELVFTESDPDNHVLSSDEIGSGAYGSVYRATWNRPADEFEAARTITVAVKVTVVHGANALKKFHREVSVLAVQATHPHTIKLFGASIEAKKDKCYIVMEYMPHGDLLHFIHCGQVGHKLYNPAHPAFNVLELMTPTQQWALAASLAEVVQTLHRLGIMHRDLKAENFLMHHDDETDEWSVRICDVGMSQAMWTHSTMSARGYVPESGCGTWTHQAPEWHSIETESTYQTRMDIYSLGICFWHLFSRSIPLEGRYEQEAMPQILQGVRLPFNFHQSLVEPWRAHAMRLVDECWSHAPNLRPKIEQIAYWFSLSTTDMDETLAVDALVAEMGTSWNRANAALTRLIQRDLPLSSFAVHRVLAMHLAGSEAGAAIPNRNQAYWHFPSFRGNNQFVSLSLAGSFLDRYYDSVTDEDLKRVFVSECATYLGAPNFSRPRRVRLILADSTHELAHSRIARLVAPALSDIRVTSLDIRMAQREAADEAGTTVDDDDAEEEKAQESSETATNTMRDDRADRQEPAAESHGTKRHRAAVDSHAGSSSVAAASPVDVDQLVHQQQQQISSLQSLLAAISLTPNLSPEISALLATHRSQQ